MTVIVPVEKCKKRQPSKGIVVVRVMNTQAAGTHRSKYTFIGSFGKETVMKTRGSNVVVSQF